MAGTKPKTYRVSEEVDAELRRLAKVHGGVDKALRATLPFTSLDAVGPLVESGRGKVTVETYHDPAQIPGVAVGVPPPKAGQFPCRCVHSGCQGAKFQGTSKFANLCTGCEAEGHRGDRHDCPECWEPA